MASTIASRMVRATVDRRMMRNALRNTVIPLDSALAALTRSYTESLLALDSETVEVKNYMTKISYVLRVHVLDWFILSVYFPVR